MVYMDSLAGIHGFKLMNVDTVPDPCCNSDLRPDPECDDAMVGMYHDAFGI